MPEEAEEDNNEEDNDKSEDLNEENTASEEEQKQEQETNTGGLPYNYIMASVAGIAIIAAAAFLLMNMNSLQNGTETGFSPGKTFELNSLQDPEIQFNLHVLDENSTHWDGVIQIEGAEVKRSFARFRINKDTLQTATTQTVRRGQLNNENLEYSSELLQNIFLYRNLDNKSQREKLSQPGNHSLQQSEVHVTETVYNGRDAYKLEISQEYNENPSIFYIAREKPYITLGANPVSSGEITVLENVTQGIPEEIKQAEPVGSTTPTDTDGKGSCSKDIQGFSTSAIRITDIGITSNNQLAIELRNAAPETVNVTAVGLTQDQSVELFRGAEEISVGSTGTVQVDGVTESDKCNTLNIQVTFDEGQIKNQEVTGTIQGNIALQ